jgi:hypothetical protein
MDAFISANTGFACLLVLVEDGNSLVDKMALGLLGGHRDFRSVMAGGVNKTTGSKLTKLVF